MLSDNGVDQCQSQTGSLTGCLGCKVRLKNSLKSCIVHTGTVITDPEADIFSPGQVDIFSKALFIKGDLLK